jgi:hypothetical protein
MPTFLIGHGAIESGGPKTVVPAECSLTFFVDADRLLFMGNALAALESNSVQHGYRIDALGEVDNYMILPLQDDERPFFEAVRINAPGDLATAWFVGDELPADGGFVSLCEDTTGSCSILEHVCSGVLGRLSRDEFGSKDIVVLACRQVLGESSPMQEEYGTALDATFYGLGDDSGDPAATAYAWSAEADRIAGLASRLQRAHELVTYWYDNTPEAQAGLGYLRANRPSFDSDLDYYWEQWTPMWELIDELEAQDPVDMTRLESLNQRVSEMDQPDQIWIRSYPQVDQLLRRVQTG